MNHRAALGLSLCLLSSACSVGKNVDPGGEDLGSAQEPEKWSVVDDPGIFSSGLERKIGNLPAQGAANVIPWAGSYWRAAQDSINYRWAGQNIPSAARKYEIAFGGFRVEDQVSVAFGVDSQRTGRYCAYDNQCDASRGEQCGRRAGWPMGRCIPFWFGICNGWVAASLLLPEPLHGVMYDGIPFNVQDIKALMSVVHTRATVRLVSLTCRGSDAGRTIPYDGAGRPAGQECRDTNPGTFHVLLANFLGIQGKSFAEDRTFDDQIWNQPLRSYQVLEQRTISGQEANQLASGGIDSAAQYRWDRDAQQLVYLKTDVAYINEAPSETDGNLASTIDTYTAHETYEYVLELDAAGTIIGGEWAGASRRDHPDYLWIPTGVGAGGVAGGSIQYDLVRQLADASVQ